MHGKPSANPASRRWEFSRDFPEEFTVGRYHSLYAIPERMPAELEVTAESDDGVIMGVRHRVFPVEAVQFHPESILSSTGDVGLDLMRNAIQLLGSKTRLRAG